MQLLLLPCHPATRLVVPVHLTQPHGPTLLPLAGPDNLEDLKRIAQQYQKAEGDSALRAGGAAIAEDDDEVPELVEGETFEETAAKAE